LDLVEGVERKLRGFGWARTRLLGEREGVARSGEIVKRDTVSEILFLSLPVF
jgi:hypothetical protein